MKRNFAAVFVLLLACIPSFGAHTQPQMSSQFRATHRHGRDNANEKFASKHAEAAKRMGLGAKATIATANSAKTIKPKANTSGSTPSIPVNFVSAVQFPIAGENDDQTQSVTGDFNGDGKLDVASIVYNGDTYQISVLLNKGNRTFQAARLTNTPNNLDGPIIVGDLNGDGKDDLIMVHPGKPASFIVMTNNGNGTFTQGPNYTLSNFGLQGGVLTDINGDGNLDVLVVDSETPGVVIAALGNGDGTFQTPNAVAGLSTAAPGDVFFADFNGDGKLDFADISDGQVQVFLATTSGFAAPVSLITSNTAYDACNAIAGDLSGDSKPEILAVNCEDNTVTVFVNNGDGSFQTGVYYDNVGDLNTDPYGAAIADINGDGKADVLLSNVQTGAISVLLGQGDGTLTLQPNGFDVGGYPWNAPLVADFNGDGLADVMQSDDWFSFVYLQGYGDGTFQAALTYFLPNSVGTDQYSEFVATGDFNGDGIPDVVTGNYSNGTAAGIVVYLSRGDGTLGPGVNYGTSASLEFVTVGDFNGDGKLDVVASDWVNGVVQIFLGNGDGTFSVGGTYATDTGDSEPLGLAVGDFNHDGHLDLAVANAYSGNIGVLLGVGDGTFGAVTTYFVDAWSYYIAAVDLNNDGYLDLAVTNYWGEGESEVTVFLANNDNSGTFQTPGLNYGITGYAEGIAFGDLNKDGKIDMAVTTEWGTTYPGEIDIALGNGDGTFQSSTAYVSSGKDNGMSQSWPGTIQMYDFNGDGNLDLVYVNADAGTLAVALGTGTGSVGIPYEFPTNAYSWGMALGDVNNDGAMDVVTANDESGGVSVLLNANGSGVVHTYTLAAQSTTATVAAGSAATYALALTGRNGYTGTVSFTCSGLPAAAACSFSPASVAIAGNTTESITLTISTTGAAAALAVPNQPNQRPGEPIFLASLGSMGLVGLLVAGSGKNRNRRNSRLLLAVMVMLMLCTLVGCSGVSSATKAPVTPAGTYTVTVTPAGTGYGTDSTPLTLTLVVQ